MSLSKRNFSNNKLDAQVKHLRQMTKTFRGLPGPLIDGPEINTLEELIAALHKAFETDVVNIDLVNHLLLSYKSKPMEWKKYEKFVKEHYTRNLVDTGNGRFNLILLCWAQNQRSTIHDHADSHCFMKLLQGELREVRYEWPNTRKNVEKRFDEIMPNETEGLREIGEKPIKLNEVAYINDNLGLHRVENPFEEGAVSLHLYCPPFDECAVFEKNTGKKQMCAVKFYSKYGIVVGGEEN